MAFRRCQVAGHIWIYLINHTSTFGFSRNDFFSATTLNWWAVLFRSIFISDSVFTLLIFNFKSLHTNGTDSQMCRCGFCGFIRRTLSGRLPSPNEIISFYRTCELRVGNSSRNSNLIREWPPSCRDFLAFKSMWQQVTIKGKKSFFKFTHSHFFNVRKTFRKRRKSVEERREKNSRIEGKNKNFLRIFCLFENKNEKKNSTRFTCGCCVWNTMEGMCVRALVIAERKCFSQHFSLRSESKLENISPPTNCG